MTTVQKTYSPSTGQYGLALPFSNTTEYVWFNNPVKRNRVYNEYKDQWEIYWDKPSEQVLREIKY